MKFLFAGILFLCFLNLSWSQDSDLKFNRPFVIFEGCDDNDDKVKCYDIKLHELIGKNLNNKVFKDSIFLLAKKDSITVPASILYDENGVIVKSFSSISNPVKGSHDKLKGLLDSIPQVKPVLDEYNNGVASTVTNLFAYVLDRTKDSIIPILGFKPTEVPFSVIEKVPVYKGCNEDLSNQDLVKCMNGKVSELISKHFNIKLAGKLGLPNGLKRIFVEFKIDKKGRVTAIRARGPHPDLEKEAIRVIEKMPRLKSPGYFRNKKVIVPYAIPIIFRVTD